jgi:hypothetical protein
MQKQRDPKVASSAYGLGWSAFANSGVRVVSHSGGLFGVGARLTLLPEKDVACVVLTNASTGMQGTDLWEVEWEIFKAVVPGFPEAPQRQAPASPQTAFSPPDSLIGVWEGKVRISGGDIPVKLTVEKAGAVRLNLAGQESPALTGPTPLGSLRFRDGVLIAPFLAGLKTADTARGAHILLLEAKLRGEALDGALSAVAMNQRFCYSHGIGLRRSAPDQAAIKPVGS